jgi:hypothetical protein
MYIQHPSSCWTTAAGAVGQWFELDAGRPPEPEDNRTTAEAFDLVHIRYD